jgi:hypothetical protein
MKVIENGPDRLVFRQVPVRAGLVLGGVALGLMLWGWALWHAGEPKGGAALAGIGLIVLVLGLGGLVKVRHVTLDRTRDVVEIVETGLFGKKQTAHVLHDLHGATLQSKLMKPIHDKDDTAAQRRRRKDTRVWRVALVHRNGHAVPLTDAYSSEASVTKAAALINGWFGRPLQGGASG